MRPLQRPQPSRLRPMPASSFRVPVPVTLEHASPDPAANLKIFKNDIFFKMIITYISHTFFPTALSCALPAF
ncbi:unnamed protein product [Staurois parvus]|uniref:Uncharacterized protein n=1 Tax=Staurois parvus TaxID=386267 RepID=A0ABN9BE51_9NEOB|nr:unnamed protein product [Staurois parvus]